VCIWASAKVGRPIKWTASRSDSFLNDAHGRDTVSNVELALDANERARAIDANFGELYLTQGIYWYWGHLDYERALYNLDKTIEMMPGNDEAYMWRGYVSRRAGLWEQALQSMQQALKLNPRVHYNWHEYALTALYMHQYLVAKNAVMQARELAPDSFWGRTTLAQIIVQESGDMQSALQLTVGAQHSDDYDFFEAYMSTRILAHQYDQALRTARELSGTLEIQQGRIVLKEDWAAQVLHYMGRADEARQAANAALFRLQGLRQELGDDFRIDLAEARLSAIRGDAPEKISELVRKSHASRPGDNLAEFEFNSEYASIFAIAGMTSEAVEMLELLWLPPSGNSVHIVDLNPAFDAIREKPEFVAMMERQR